MPNTGKMPTCIYKTFVIKLNQSEGEKRRGRMRVKKEEKKLRRTIIEDIERERGRRG